MTDSPKIGRPLITQADFPKDWKEHVLAEMTEGASQREIQGYLDISDKTFTRLMKDDKDFFRTLKRGLRLSALWWERQGRTSLRDKEFSYVGWYMNMKNRFGWRDKTETDLTSGGKPLPLLGGIAGDTNNNSDQEASVSQEKN